MKNVLKLAVIVALVILSAGSYAQSKMKFGHIDVQKIIQLMPEREQAKDSLEALTKKLSEELEVMQVEFSNMYEKFVEKEPNLSKLAKQDGNERLGNMQQRIAAFQEAAQQEIAKAEGDLLKPIYDKLKKAIKNVGEEGGFIYVFDVSAVLFYSDQSKDVSELVKTKLNIKE